MITNKIDKVVISKKLDKGFLAVYANGKELKRRFKEHSKGRFSGKTTFNVWDNVYSFPSLLEKDKELDEIEIYQITYEGRYLELYGAKSSSHGKKKKTWDEPTKHSKYDDILACVDSNVPVYLVGPAGSGKNYTLEEIAKALGMNFYYSNSVQQEYKLTGFIDAGGDYHGTEFYKACKDASEGKDVIFFLDEMDASIPEVLVLLNAAIANGYFEFPNGKLEFGEKVHFVAAGNTFGNGADEAYTGRLVLDQATLDRFAVIEFGYDTNVEMHIAKGNASLVDFVEALRNKAEEIGIRATFSYRCISMVTQLEKKLPLEKVLKMAILKGFDEDTIKTLRLAGANKYFEALRKLQA